MTTVHPTVPKSKDDISLDWLNAIFIPQGHTVSSFKWEGQANNGVGVMSTLERMTLNLESGQGLSIILKTLPSRETPLRNVAVCHGFAERELKMYTQLFPLWDEFLKARHVPQAFHFRHPICYYGAYSGQFNNQENYEQILILEDLFTSGYKMWPEGYGKSLGWKEAQPCIRLIALFHAVGLAYRKVNGIKDYKIQFPFLIHDNVHSKDMVEAFLSSGFDFARRMLVDYGEKSKGSYPEDDPSLLRLHPMPLGLMEHFEVLRENAFKNLEGLNPVDNHPTGTVIHNDLHVNNFMFRDDSQTITNDGHEVVFYDFQAPMYSLPTKDLSFFLLQNCEESLFTTGFERTLQFYHDEFHGALKAMGVPLEDFNMTRILEEYQSMGYLSMIHIIAGAAVSYSGNVTDDAKRRFYNRFVQMFNDGMLNCKIFPK